MSLATYLRQDAHLTGLKIACAEGGCGACTCVLSYHDLAHPGKLIHKAVATCLVPLCAVDGMVVTTTEGLGNSRDGLHVIQEAMVRNHATQCGMCTPGMVMELYAACLNNQHGPCMKALTEIEECFDGNLCRCTGYRAIRDAVREVVVGSAQDLPAEGHDLTLAMCERSLLSKITPPVVPEELKARHALNLCFQSPASTWLRPTTLPQLLALAAAHPGASFVAGNSEVGALVVAGKAPAKQIATTHVAELRELRLDEAHGELVVGASVTLNEFQFYLRNYLSARAKAEHLDKTHYKWHRAQALLHQLHYFASHNLRNTATVGGNVCNASPVSDMLPVMMALGAVAECAKLSGEHDVSTRSVPLGEWLRGYKKTALQPGEVLRALHIPFPTAPAVARAPAGPAASMLEFAWAQKQTRRKEDDIALVNAAFCVALEKTGEQYVVREARLAFGAMSFVTLLAPRTAAALTGRNWADPTFLTAALESLRDEMQLAPTAPGGMIRYRRVMVLSLFFKFYCGVCQSLGVHVPLGDQGVLSPDEALDLEEPETPVPTRQHYDVPTDMKHVGRPMPLLSGAIQATGEARYTSDLPLPQGGLHGVLLLSTHAHAKVLSIDASAALARPGIVALATRDDVKGMNCIGSAVHDEECFVPIGGEATCVGAPLGVLVGETEEAVRAALPLVKVEYADLPAMLTIDQAVAAGMFIEQPYVQERGDVAGAMARAAHVAEGVLYEGGQIHFCFEPNIAIATPLEGRGMELQAATQNPSLSQRLVAHVLGVPTSEIIVRTRRLGGAFGSKETRAAWHHCAVAVAAAKVRRPVRMTVNREEDMVTNGHRSPFKIVYKVGFTEDGHLLAADIQIFCNSGNSMDCSMGVLRRSVNHADGSYYCPNLRAVGRLVKTHHASNTAFRGFGAPEGELGMEVALEQMARRLGIDQADIRLRNLYHDGHVTHFHQPLEHVTLGALFEHVLTTGQYRERRAATTRFNAEHRFIKRGLGLVGVKYGCSFETYFMNQGQALVHLQQDGSVQVLHGGLEMGQGLHSKMAQVAADAFDIPIDQVTVVQETCTLENCNTQPTAASSGSDLNGMAVLQACQAIAARLEPLRREAPGKALADYARMAYMRRIDLTAHAYYATPHLGETWEVDGEKMQRLFSYFAYGAALAEVELDTLTGNFRVIRADLIQDVGRSLNPALDIGQVEGAFLQGLGLYTMEEPTWNMKTGTLTSRGPSYYKIPSWADQPHDFRVSLLPNAPNPLAVHSSKAIGEPPLYLASCVPMALSDALNAARLQRGLPATPLVWSPLTCERLRMLCGGDPCIDTINAVYDAEKRARPDAPVPPLFELPDQ